MKRKLEISELIFRIISCTLLTVFAICCLYPFLYAVSASISGRHAVEYGEVVLLPKNVQFGAFAKMFNDDMFWNSYTNTLFLTVYGTVWSLVTSILGAYALSKKRLLFRKTFNFFLVFTMWFSAGLVPQFLNYLQTQDVFVGIGRSLTTLHIQEIQTGGSLEKDLFVAGGITVETNGVLFDQGRGFGVVFLFADDLFHQ